MLSDDEEVVSFLATTAMHQSRRQNEPEQEGGSLRGRAEVAWPVRLARGDGRSEKILLILGRDRDLIEVRPL